jgi:hypothetical protein
MDEKTIARFWSKVDKRGPDECWEWQACRQNTRSRYGRFGTKRDGKKYVEYAHRVSYAIAFGSAPLVVRHSCDNHPCVNPAHLLPGTHADNNADMMARERHRVRPRKGEDHGNARLTESDVAAMRSQRKAGVPVTAIARQFGVVLSTVYRIVNASAWGHVA